jgi:hypothetical protein
VSVPDAHRALPRLNGHRLLTLPFEREAAFQAAGLWGIVQHGNFGLPHGCRALYTYGPPPPGSKLSVRVVPRAVDPIRIEYDIDLVADDGRVYDSMEGFYTVNPLTAVEASAERGGESAS